MEKKKKSVDGPFMSNTKATSPVIMKSDTSKSTSKRTPSLHVINLRFKAKTTRKSSSGSSVLKATRPHKLASDKSVYLLYEYSGAGEFSYSLGKVDIDLKEKTCHPHCSVMELKREEFPAQGMKCAMLGSKLYFLGGSYQESYKRIHPRDVYVLDVKTGELEKMGATLNTGKPHPCAVFAVNEKLYALGTIIHDPYNRSTLSPLECFDMKTGKWQVVKKLPPSKDKSIFWVGCTVLEKRQEVVLVGSERPSSDCALVKFVYNVKEDKWTRHPIFRYEEGPLTLGFHEGDEHDYLYGIHCLGLPLKSKTGCISWSEESNLFSGKPVDGLIQMSISPTTTFKGKDKAFNQPYLYSSRTVRHLGSNYFCYITFGYLHSDLNGRGIKITLFKELEQEQQKLSFTAEILDSKSDVFKAQAELIECFVVTPDWAPPYRLRASPYRLRASPRTFHNFSFYD